MFLIALLPLGFWISGVSIWWRRKVSKLVVVCNLTIIDKGPFIAWDCLKSSSTTSPRSCGWQPQVNSQNSRSTPFCFWNLSTESTLPILWSNLQHLLTSCSSTSQLMLKTCTLDPHPPIFEALLLDQLYQSALANILFLQNLFVQTSPI